MDYSELTAFLSARGVQLIAVSKTFSAESIMAIYNRGHRAFGENRVQEMCEKRETLPGDIEWHMIGHLQRNKVKYIAPFVHLIHSVDGFALLQEIDKQGRKHQRVLDCLLQFHIAREESKFGFSEEEAVQMLESDAFRQLKHIRLRGVMGMATFTDDKAMVRAEFAELKRLFLEIQSRFFAGNPDFSEVSMGMSGDWDLAVEQGSTMVRIGSLIFGSRETNQIT